MPSVQSSNGADLLSQAQHFLTRASEGSVNSEQESAWNAFYEYHTRKIRAFAFTCGANDDEVGDCIQEVWAELLVRLPTFQLDPSRGSFDTWLFPIVRSKTTDWLRRRRKHCPDHRHSEPLNAAADHRRPPTQVLEDAESAALAWTHVKKCVGGRNLDVLKMRLFDQRPVAEVAEKLGISPEQVSIRFHRARKELERIGRAWSQGMLAQSPDGPVDDKKKNPDKSAQEIRLDSVSRNVGSSIHECQGGTCVDYVFQRLELGRRELSPEWYSLIPPMVRVSSANSVRQAAS
jgi:RNA polymerase sigma factor (sigma-70 family)